MGDNNSAAVPTATCAGADELRPLQDVVSSLPPLALRELLSMGVCAQCICRMFGNCSPDFASSLQSCDTNDGVGNVCRICCGILQFIHVVGDGTVVKHNCASDLAVWISELVKKEGHHADSFSLEVSVASTVLENESAFWLSLKKKYGPEDWFHEKLQNEAVSVKDALKLLITSPLEKLLGLKSSFSSFRVRLTYSFLEESVNGKHKLERDQVAKKRKTGFNGSMGTVYGSVGDRKEQGADISTNEAGLAIGKCSRSMQDFESNSKVSACCLACLCYRTAVYIGGRYLKFSRNVSQTCWIIDDERMGEASVEEIVGNIIFPACQADGYKFHAAGREDIDVRMLGSGRPFLVEIENARIIPSDELVEEMEMKINSLDKKLVKVKNLKAVDNQGWALMREGEAEKQKQYAALVWIPRQLEDQDLQTISSLQDLKLTQRTPIRVLHRRSPLDREKIIHWMKIEKIEGSSQYFLLHLCAQAGTYIKEFVHGDLGRTYPSIGSILGCRAEILQLDVTDVKMDCF